MTQGRSAPQPGWQAEHARRYIETGGADGHIWNGATTLLLTTKGRRSGEERTTPLIYGKDGDRYVVVASKGGAPENPDWYRNLSVNPAVEVQVMADNPRVGAYRDTR
jgi:deazaflavin-dependent oxidoreductase (nitroreductase family)